MVDNKMNETRSSSTCSSRSSNNERPGGGHAVELPADGDNKASMDDTHTGTDKCPNKGTHRHKETKGSNSTHRINPTYVSSCSESSTHSYDDEEEENETTMNSSRQDDKNSIENMRNQNTNTQEEAEEEEKKDEIKDEMKKEETQETLAKRVRSLEAQLESLTNLLTTILQSDSNDNTNTLSPMKLPIQPQRCSSMILNDCNADFDESEESETELAKIDHPQNSSSPQRSQHHDASPTPTLEYRSYTPTYEEELRRFRKSSRGMSLDRKSSSDNLNKIQNELEMESNNNVNATATVAVAVVGTSSVVDHESAESIYNNHSTHTITSSTHTNKESAADDMQSTENNNNSNNNYCNNSSNHSSSNNKVPPITGTNGDKNKSQLPPIAPKHNNETTSTATATTTGNNNTNIEASDETQSLLNTTPTTTTTVTNTTTTSSTPCTNTITTNANIKSSTKLLGKLRSKKQTIMDFINSLNLDSIQHDGSPTDDVDANMEEFLRIPYRVEEIMAFGTLICADSFLHVLTVTPLKFLWSCLCLLCTIFNPKGEGKCRFHRRHLYQFVRVFVIYAVYRYCLSPISIGKMYHWIRGQAMLKLYVLMAMVEVFDRLMCSFGQDALDSLFWNTTRRPYHPRIILSVIVVLVYAIIHSYILFVHVATLNVAMNSADQTLLTLLISGNFAEIKSTVFKKYNKQNLFKIVTSDICERFKLVMFLGLVLLLNCSQGGMNQEMVNDYVKMTGIILFAEMLCDWIKHSFITKFNFIKSSAYQDYALILAGDIKGVGKDGANIDHTHAVVKRIGFAQIPLACVMARYVAEAVRYVAILGDDGDSNHVLHSMAVLLSRGSWSQIMTMLISLIMMLIILKGLLSHIVQKQCDKIILYGPSEHTDASLTATKGTQRRQAV